MRSRPAGYHNRLSGLVFLVMLTGCAQHSMQDSDAIGTNSSSRVQDVDALFDQNNTDPGNGLSALDLEHLGLGDYWNTLDENGDGQISRQEFRKRFDDPAFQRQLQGRLQRIGEVTSEEAVSDSWRLPPEPASQTWHRSSTTATPATLSAPSPIIEEASPQTTSESVTVEPDAMQGNTADDLSF